MRRKRLATIFLTAILTLSLMTACTQTTPSSSSGSGTPASGQTPQVDWPKRSVEIIVPFAPGGDSDFNARVLAEKLTAATGQIFTVTNVTGNSGAVGTLQVQNSNPDGYTILFNHFAFAINNFVGISDLTYDDMALCSFVGLNETMTLVARSELGLTKISEVEAYAKQNPGKLVYGSTAGAIPLLPGLQFIDRGIDVTLVDAGGTADRLAAILGGHVDFTLIPISNASDYLKIGDLVILEDDIGLNAFTQMYYQLFFPAGTDPAIIEELNKYLEQIILTDEDYAKTIYEGQLQEPFYLNSADGLKFAKEVWADFEKLDWTV